MNAKTSAINAVLRKKNTVDGTDFALILKGIEERRLRSLIRKIELKKVGARFDTV